jgi:peptide/nickel transport system permease protein
LSFWVGVVWLATIVTLSALAPVLPIPGYEDSDFGRSLAKPGWNLDYLLGADRFGHSVLSQILWGARTSLTVGVAVVIVGMLVGGAAGVCAGYFRGFADRIFLIVTDMMLSFPGLILLLAMVTVLERNLRNIVVALAVVSIPGLARLTRANTLVFAEREFVLAARAMGARNGRIILREIVPNVALPLLSYLPLVVSGVIVAEGSLAFLGLSLPPPRPSWGKMVADGREQLNTNPHLTIIPGAALFLTVLSLNWIGQRFRLLYDPRQRTI